MRFTTAAAAAALITALLAAPGTAAAAPCTSPASAYSSGGAPGGGAANDPLFSRQWGLAQIKAPSAWQRGDRGSGATIAVVDSGVDLGHPDLQAKLVPGVDTTPADAQGCDGPFDENGHGTHVAGIAAASTGNGIGVAGTAPDAKIMPVRVLASDGRALDPEIIAGIKWAADNGADVINLSIGGFQVVAQMRPLNEELAQAVEYAYSKGAVVVAAAGNETIPLCSYPAASQRAICVGATDRRGSPSYYSNFPNSAEENVGVRAPGGEGSLLAYCESDGEVWSTVSLYDDPGTDDSEEGDPCKDTAAGEIAGYDAFAGSSMAAPHVAGVAALLAAKGLTNAQIMECIRTTSSGKGTYDPVMGYGVVDADAATRTCSPASTPAFAPSSGGPVQDGSRTERVDYLNVTVKQTSRSRLARTRKVLLTIRSSKPVKVKLRAVVRGSRRSKARTAGRRTVTLTKAGERRAYLRISRRAARALRGRKAIFQVRYAGGGHKGVARAR